MQSTRKLPRLTELFVSYGFLESEVEIILSFFEIKELKKKEMFSSEGKVATKMAFIEDGAFHYYYDNDGDLITTFISLEYNLITSISSFISGMPSTENIQAITDSTIAVISKESINQLRKDIPRFQVFYIEAIERQVVCLDTSRLELLTLTSEQRYLRLLELHPQILQRIPLKLLATTLGMTTRHLTRIRKSIVSKFRTNVFHLNLRPRVILRYN